MKGDRADNVARGSIVVAIRHRGMRVGVMDQLVDLSDRLVVASPEEAILETLKSFKVDLMVIQPSRAGQRAVDLVRRIRRSSPSLRIIVLSLDDSEVSRRALAAAGADRVVFAPEVATQFPVAARELLSELDVEESSNE